MIVVSYCEEDTCGSGTVQGHLTDTLRSLWKTEILPEIDPKISNIERDLKEKDQKIDDLQESFEDQLSQKDQKIADQDRVINSLTNTVNEMKAQIQVRSKISKSM